MKYDTNIVVAVDYDNTLTKGSSFHNGTGCINKRAMWWMKKIQTLDVVAVLWTTRDGRDLNEALETLEEFDIKFNYVNEYPFRNSSRKVNADVYIDDKANDGKIRWIRTYCRISRLVRKKRSGKCTR